MCGICGEFRFDGQPADALALAQMSERMSPRGPDADGLFAQSGVGLGHRRLKIIDVSERSQQPMVDTELGMTIVFNGAIYNYRELRRQLEGRGYRFFSDGDTEVILKAYHAWGAAALERFHGMFAFAIWERDRDRLFLARDALGIKPLYLAELPGALRFASSLPALMAAGGIPGDVDPVALHHYLTFHSVVPPPHTIFRRVKKLAPGHHLTLERDGRCDEKRWFELRFETDDDERGLSEADWRDRTLEALRVAVERRRVADVPVGVLLSGGLDSSLVVGLLAEAGHADLQTFSIGFESIGDERGDEFQYSDVVAKHFGTDHHKIFVGSDRVLPALESCVESMSEPMVSHDVIGFYLLSQEVARHVKVVQSGQGADEVFGGYHWYPPLLESKRAVDDYARVFFDRDHREIEGLLEPGIADRDWSRAFVEEHFAQPGAPRHIDKALRIDTTVMLVDDPVKRVDNMTMAWGLEARVPFLDRELVELAARIPAEHKIASGGKHVLKEAARKVIPSEVIDRPKGYFPVPALKYIRGAYLDRVREILGERRARERGLFRRAAVDELLARPDAHITPLRGSKLWQVALLEYWLQLHEPA